MIALFKVSIGRKLDLDGKILGELPAMGIVKGAIDLVLC